MVGAILYKLVGFIHFFVVCFCLSSNRDSSNLRKEIIFTPIKRRICWLDDQILHLLIPQAPVYPNSKLYVPVFLEQPPAVEPTRHGGSQNNPRGRGKGRGGGGATGGRATGRVGVVVVRAAARKGSRIVGVEESSPNWNIK